MTGFLRGGLCILNEISMQKSTPPSKSMSDPNPTILSHPECITRFKAVEINEEINSKMSASFHKCKIKLSCYEKIE